MSQDTTTGEPPPSPPSLSYPHMAQEPLQQSPSGTAYIPVSDAKNAYGRYGPNPSPYAHAHLQSTWSCDYACGAAAPHGQGSYPPGRPQTIEPSPTPQRSVYVHQPYYSPFTTTTPGVSLDANTSRSLPVQRPPSVVYNTPPNGSLGTPMIGSAMWSRTPQGHQPRSHNASRGSGGSRSHPFASLSSSPGGGTPHGRHLTLEELEHITLVPTRPLLKALAKQCRPCAPWCVGAAASATMPLGEELMRFCQFVSPTPSEAAMNEVAQAFITDVFNAVYPGAVLEPMAATAAGQPQTKAGTTHLLAREAEDSGEETKTLITEAVTQRGGNVEFAVDDRGLPCALCTHSRSGKRFCVRYGADASSATASAHLLADAIANVPTRRATLCALLALLEQNKILDSSGIRKGQLTGEAVAVMLLAVVNSYGPNDEPDSGRLLLDFFMTFGFQTNFDFVVSSVTCEGMRRPAPKAHLNAQLDVIDPGDHKTNLTPNVERAANLQAVFNYCFTALSQYQQINTSQRRAQSALSTIIGGEPYWSRVLMMFEEGIEPFYSTVLSKKAILAQNL